MGVFFVALKLFAGKFGAMSDRIGETVGQIIRYTNTPLQALTLCVVGLILLLWFGPLEVIGQYIILGLIAFVLVSIILMLIFNHKKLQFTAEEHILWQKEFLSDSSMNGSYLSGSEGMLLGPKDGGEDGGQD